MTEYYVSGCIEKDGNCEMCADDLAQFWTLYERNEKGESQAVGDYPDKQSAEAVMFRSNKRELSLNNESERRITACVNAFDGIPTERIEGKDLGQILAGEMRLHGAGPRNDGGFGFEFSGGVCQLMAEAYAEQFKESGAINYLELLFDHTEIGPLTITMQRVQGLTPAQKLAQAEAERDALQQQVNALEPCPLCGVRSSRPDGAHYCHKPAEPRPVAAVPVKVLGAGKPCPNCGSEKHTWQATVIQRNAIPHGRLRLNETSGLFYLGCDECSETLLRVSADDVAQLLNAGAEVKS